MSAQSLLDGLGSVAAFVLEHPWSLLPLGALILALVLLAGPVGGGSDRRDPKRTFTAAERTQAFTRAGLRCEHKPLLWIRCTSTPTQGDHIYPWSRGGRTAMSNQQALCAFHNNRKSGTVPSRAYIIRLQRRRRRYFPPEESCRVEWRLAAAL